MRTPVTSLAPHGPHDPRHAPPGPAAAHCRALETALARLRERELPRVERWGRALAAVLPAGGRLLAAGNGGSAAQAQHLTAELVGRYRRDRPAFSAIALHAETSTVTAIGNDYGFEELYARQVAAHGRPGDVLVALSTSGGSPNLLRAAEAAHAAGLAVWAMTGPRPNPLAALADDALCIDTGGGGAGTGGANGGAATVQEAHLVALHLVCEAFDAALAPVADGARAGRALVAHAPADDVPSGAAPAGPAVRTEHP